MMGVGAKRALGLYRSCAPRQRLDENGFLPQSESCSRWAPSAGRAARRPRGRRGARCALLSRARSRVTSGMSPRPGPHPHPPPNFGKKPLSLRTFPAKTRWHRFHRERLQATFFGKSGLYRFDDPKRGYGVLYLAEHLEGAFVEVFLRDPEPFRFVTRMALESRVPSILRASRSVKLVDLVGAGLARMGVDSRLTTGSYKVAQGGTASARRPCRAL